MSQITKYEYIECNEREKNVQAEHVCGEPRTVQPTVVVIVRLLLQPPGGRAEEHRGYAELQVHVPSLPGMQTFGLVLASSNPLRMSFGDM